MAEKKGLQLRDKVINFVAKALMDANDVAEIPQTKEGMLMEFEDKQFVVKVIQKKNPVHQEDVKGMLVLDELVLPGEEEEGFEADAEAEVEETFDELDAEAI